MSTNPPPGGYPQPEYPQGYSAPGSQPPYQQSPYQQPGYEQPGYDQNGYAQPGVPPQGFDQGGAAWGYAPVPPRKSHTLRNVLLILTALVLVGGGVIAYYAVNVAKTVGANKLVPPASFQSFARQDANPNLASVQSSAQTLATTAHLTPSVAIYGTSATSTSPSFLFMGGYGSTLGAAFGISDFWKGMSGDQGVSVSDQTDESAGSLGGSMQCAQVHLAALGKSLPVCVWADNSGFGSIMDYSRAGSADLSGTAAMTLAFRQVAEVKK
ncbi:hypothetical protein [Streptacidiphilus anmyonensis]|uniref:hypothetical protein n=1 Tax=Streptacidiphilus anmyonensis TaxID=405782 RepID=UPI0005A68960|nr:hypothetical protein [Streptacidiphilus anmyonensis]